MNSYEQRRAARIERLRARAERKASEANAAHASATARAAIIPLGQPILVGHHSEGRHRRYRARIDASFRKAHALAAESTELERRADAAESNEAISGDDPDATAKLRAKLAECERRQAAIVAANKRLRAGATFVDVAPMLDWWTAPLARLEILASMGHRTIPPTNGAAEIQRIKARIAELEARAAAPVREPVIGAGVRIDEAENRVRIWFEAKPSEEVRARLKSAGFRWAPSVGAWHRHASPAAWYAARRVIGAP